MTELNAVAGWIYRQLAASTVITNFVGRDPAKDVWRIYERVAPENATYPLVVFAYISGVNRTFTGNKRVFAHLVYDIKVYDENQESYEDIGPIMDELDKIFQIDQLLTDNVVAGATPMQPIQREDDDRGRRRNCLGIRCEILAYSVPS